MKMPEDIGLVGFNNEPITGLVTPAISSVEMPCFEMGKAAAKFFIEMMNSDTDMTKREMVFQPKLFIRESSQRLPASKK